MSVKNIHYEKAFGININFSMSFVKYLGLVPCTDRQGNVKTVVDSF